MFHWHWIPIVTNRLSIAASVACLLTSTGQIARKAGALYSSVENAPASLLQIQEQMDEMNMILCQVRLLLGGITRPNTSSRLTIISVHHLMATLSGCVVLCSNLDMKLGSVLGRLVGAFQEIELINKWTPWTDVEAAEIIEDLQRHKLSLSLMLNILQCNDWVDAAASLAQLHDIIRKILKSNPTISTQLRELIKHHDDSPYLPEAPSADTGAGIDTAESTCQNPLSISKYSKRVQAASSAWSDIPFDGPSSSPKGETWSMLSDIIFGGTSIPEISVLELPICLSDLPDPGIYIQEVLKERNLAPSALRTSSLPKWSSRGRLHNAIKANNRFAVHSLLTLGASIDEADADGRTALICAAILGNVGICVLLLDRGAEPNFIDSSGSSALLYAAEKGHEDILRLLFARGNVFNIDIGNTNRNTCQILLLGAAQEGHEDIARLLLARGDVDINTKDNSGSAPLAWAAEGGHEAVVRLLLARDNVDINTKDNDGMTPLSWAAGQGHESVVRLLLARDDVYVNTADDLGRTPLSHAAENGREAVVRVLLGRDDVDIGAKDEWGETALSLATKMAHKAVVELLDSRLNRSTKRKSKLSKHFTYLVR